MARTAPDDVDHPRDSEEGGSLRRSGPWLSEASPQAADTALPNPLRNGTVPAGTETRHVDDPRPQVVPIAGRRNVESAATREAAVPATSVPDHAPSAPAPAAPSVELAPVATSEHKAVAHDSIAFKVPEFRDSALPEPPPSKPLLGTSVAQSLQTLPGPSIEAAPNVAHSTKVEPAAENPLGHAASSGKEARPAYDPVKENGTIFDVENGKGRSWTWPKPNLALLITGRQEGYFEPCGCAGLDRMKGGMDRRDKLLKKMKESWKCPCLPMDVGGLAKGRGLQAEIKFQTMVSALKDMKYCAIGLGVTDLHLSATELMSVTASLAGQPASPFVSANVGLIEFNPQTLQSYRLLEAAGMKLAVTGVLGKTFQNQINDPEVLMADPVQKLTPLVPLLQEQKPDHMVLLAFASKDESIALGKQFPQFDIVVTAGGPPEPPREVETIPETGALLVEVGEKTMNAMVLAFYGPKQPIRYQRVPLDSRFDDQHAGAGPVPLSAMQQFMASYQDGLKNVGFEGLGLHASPYPKQELLGRFVGSEQCKSCHEGSFIQWKKTPHSRAYQTLAKLPVPRVFDPECISCHVVGWDTQNFFPYQSGYRSLAATPQLINVGCESCHGPGERHIIAENGSDEALKTKIQQLIKVSKEDAQGDNHPHRCQNCHDLDNSPAFKFEVYFPKIEHHD
jgi:hypothetical protein